MKLKKRQADSVDSTPGKAETRHVLGARDNAPSAQWILTALLILCLVLFTWHPAAARQRDVMDKAGAAGSNFAIADFDGDSLPDFASVQPGLAMASQTSYRIHFRFSLGQQSSFTLTAPTGGLQIASRDVNGDSFLDLIVSTSIANEPVAVLLNDGRGNFRLADTGAFGRDIWQARAEWRAGAVRWVDEESALAGAGWAAAIGGARAALLPAMGEVSIAPERTNCLVLPHEYRGRAPPTA